MSKYVKKSLLRVVREQRGITGLETAIVLIAFVVVSSVFAFAVLSTGLFSSDQAKETISAGLKEAQGTLELQGETVVNATLTDVVAEAVGTGDSADTTWPLDNGPIIAGSLLVYVNAVLKTEGAANDYTIDDYNSTTPIITFAVAPGVVPITADYTYYAVTSVVFQLANSAGGKAVDLTAGQNIISYQDADNLAVLDDVGEYTLTWVGDSDGDNLLESGEKAQITIPVTAYNLYRAKDFKVQVKPQAGATVVLARAVPANVETVMVIK